MFEESVLNLNESQLKNSEISKEDFIKFNKLKGNIINNGLKELNKEPCLICKENKTFCNSHSIPRFMLKNISEKGKVKEIGSILDIITVNSEVGLNKALTFNLICSNCDKSQFEQYENEKNYNNELPSQQMLAQIALKTAIQNIYKKRVEKIIYSSLPESMDMLPHIESTKNILELDLNENMKDFNRFKQFIKKDNQQKFDVIWHKELNYIVPLAFQNVIALPVDLEGNVINNIYNMSKNYKIQMLHICVFPLKDKTVIILFREKKANRYKQFKKQFNKKSLEEKVEILNYILLLFSEDILINESIMSKYNEKTKDVIGKHSLRFVLPENKTQYNDYTFLKKQFNLKNSHEVYNFLKKN